MAIWASFRHRSWFRVMVLEFHTAYMSAPLGWREDDGLLVVFARRTILSEYVVTIITCELAFNDV